MTADAVESRASDLALPAESRDSRPQPEPRKERKRLGPKLRMALRGAPGHYATLADEGLSFETLVVGALAGWGPAATLFITILYMPAMAGLALGSGAMDLAKPTSELLPVALAALPCGLLLLCAHGCLMKLLAGRRRVASPDVTQDIAAATRNPYSFSAWIAATIWSSSSILLAIVPLAGYLAPIWMLRCQARMTADLSGLGLTRAAARLALAWFLWLALLVIALSMYLGATLEIPAPPLEIPVPPHAV